MSFKKQAAGFVVILLLLMTVQGVLSLRQARSLGESSERIAASSSAATRSRILWEQFRAVDEDVSRALALTDLSVADEVRASFHIRTGRMREVLKELGANGGASGGGKDESDLEAAFERWVKLTLTHLSESEQTEIANFNELADARAKLASGVDEYSNTRMDAAARLLSSNQSLVASGIQMIAVSLLVGLFVAISLSAWGLRRLDRVLGGDPAEAGEAANRVAGGDLHYRIRVHDGDTTSLMAAMARMQASLRTRIDELARVKLALDVATLPVRIADENGHILYVNDRMRTILRRDEAAIRQHHPQFSADDIEGASAGIFHADATAAEERLRGLQHTETSTLELAGRFYEVTTTPIRAADGKALGTTSQWLDRTEQIAAEEELRELVAAAATGDFAGRVSLQGKDGFYRQLAEGLNEVMKTTEGALVEFSGILEAMANGDTARAVGGHYQGTLGRLKESLTGRMDGLTRTKLALDVAMIPVRIADENGKILYVNDLMRSILKRDEAAIRQVNPAFEADRIIGASVGIFHADPAAAIANFRQLTQTNRFPMRVGGRLYDVTATPIRSADGKSLGTTAQWIDRTEQTAAEDELRQIVTAAAIGDFSRRAALEGKSGFYLQLAEGLNGVLSTTESALDEFSRMLAALAVGDLTQTLDGQYQGTLANLVDSFGQTVERLTGMVDQIRTASQMINGAAARITHNGEDLARRTREQTHSLETTADSMQELTATVRQNAENALQANRLAEGASQVAIKGGHVVRQVVSTMSGISDASKRIADIIGTIDGIAFQTNILALNAAVEAARAGEQGRGFAVVASEVRNLAQRSANAAKEIKELITDSVRRVDDGALLVADAGKTMDEIVSSFERVTGIMTEISAATQEQSSGIEQVNAAIAQMDETTQQNAALVVEAASSAASMQKQSEQLVEVVSVFRLASRSRAGAPKAPALT